MKGLVIKDAIVLSKRVKRMLFIVPIFAVIGDTGVIMSLLVCGLLVNTAFAYDDLAKWNNIAAMMPYSASAMVLSKFVLGYLGLALGTIVVTAIQLVVSFVLPNFATLNMSLLFTSLFSTLIVIAVFVPLILKIGVEKARFVPAFLLVAISALISYLSVSSVDDISRMEFIESTLLVALPVVAVLANIISIFLSINIFKANLKKV